MYATIADPGHDDVAGRPVLHAGNSRVKAHRGPAARAFRVVLLQDTFHDSWFVEQVAEARAEENARGDVVTGCIARGAMARARRHVAGLWCRGAGGSFLRLLTRDRRTGVRRAGGSVLLRAPRGRRDGMTTSGADSVVDSL